MNESRTRLLQCFAAVFPELTSAQAESASAESISGWDSVATVTLAALIEEEFACSVEPEDYEKMTSFQGCLHLVESR